MELQLALEFIALSSGVGIVASKILCYLKPMNAIFKIILVFIARVGMIRNPLRSLE